MRKTKELLATLVGLGEGVIVRDVQRSKSKDGTPHIDISVNNTIHHSVCPSCGSQSCHGHGSIDTFAYHIPLGERQPCRILYKKKRYLCKDCGSTFMERIDWVRNGTHLTIPLADTIKEDLHHLMTKKEIARVNGISVHFVDRVLISLVPSVPDHLPEMICLDETHSEVAAQQPCSPKTAWVKFTTNFSDGQTGELLDVLPFRSTKRMAHYFNDNFSYEQRCQVKYLCSDMAECYLGLTKRSFPNAIACLDNFHVIQRLNKGVNAVRVKQQNALLAKHDSSAYSDLKHLSHKLLTSAARQSALWKDHAGDISERIRTQIEKYPELKDAYAMLQYFHEIFDSCFTFDAKMEQLNLWIKIFGKSTSEPIYNTVLSVQKHLPYIRNAWANGCSNATCEGNNNVIQTVKTMSYGIHTFLYFRTRMLLIAGRPGISRSRKSFSEISLYEQSFFYDDFPSLEEYILAYDWSNPNVDMSKKGV